jgi:hypothetical protein
MSPMEPTDTSRSTRDYPRTPDGKYKYTKPDGRPLHQDYPRTPDGKYKYTTSDGGPLHFEPSTIPDIIGPNFLIPPLAIKLFRKLFRRRDTPTAP